MPVSCGLSETGVCRSLADKASDCQLSSAQRWCCESPRRRTTTAILRRPSGHPQLAPMAPLGQSMLDAALAERIRNATFALQRQGYSVEQVDRRLNALATALEADRPVDPTNLTGTGVRKALHGYDIRAVDQFFEDVRARPQGDVTPGVLRPTQRSGGMPQPFGRSGRMFSPCLQKDAVKTSLFPRSRGRGVRRRASVRAG